MRWLLFQPTARAAETFAKDEMFFCANPMFDRLELTGGAQPLFVWTRDPVYRNENAPTRSGACYIVRKGGDKPRLPETSGGKKIDGLNHREVARIFNESEVFYSYDEATFYSVYAALCGCVSVVVPGQYSSREEWIKALPLAKFGVAYGIDDIAHAKSTMHLVEGLLREEEEKGVESVRQFAEMTQRVFGAEG
ncbi:hypothetical protein ACW9UR_21370 [Halovulum sp. GXIMD14794]